MADNLQGDGLGLNQFGGLGQYRSIGMQQQIQIANTATAGNILNILHGGWITQGAPVFLKAGPPLGKQEESALEWLERRVSEMRVRLP